MEMEYFTIMRAEQKPDVYGGKECDEHIPMWEAYAEGDMESEHSTEPLTLDPKSFPPGTRIIIEEPVCPECHCAASVCMEVGECDFDWKEWADNLYS